MHQWFILSLLKFTHFSFLLFHFCCLSYSVHLHPSSDPLAHRGHTAAYDIIRHNPHGNHCVVTNSITGGGGGIELEKSIYTQISWQSKGLGKEMHKKSL